MGYDIRGETGRVGRTDTDRDRLHVLEITSTQRCSISSAKISNVRLCHVMSTMRRPSDQGPLSTRNVSPAAIHAATRLPSGSVPIANILRRSRNVLPVSIAEQSYHEVFLGPMSPTNLIQLPDRIHPPLSVYRLHRDR